MEKYYDQVVNMYLAGCSIRTIFLKTKVSGDTIRRRIRIFANENSIMNSSMKQSTSQLPKNTPEEKEEISELRAEIKRLKRQLEDEQLRAKLYAKMIEITEKDLNISITKKAGVKR